MKLHELKVLPEFYGHVAVGLKTSEVRKNDRDFKQGDLLWLREYLPAVDYQQAGRYTGLETVARIMHVLPGGQFGIAEEYCVLSIRLVTLP